MPAIETLDRYQKAVYWERTGYDTYGQPTVAEPVEISVRWETGKREVDDGKGGTISFDAEAVVDRTIPIGSRMWFGELSDWVGTGSAGGDDDVHIVVIAPEIKDIKGRAIRRTCPYPV